MGKKNEMPFLNGNEKKYLVKKTNSPIDGKNPRILAIKWREEWNR